MTVCRICGTDGEHILYNVREMQFGTRAEFVYFECTNCQCLQLRDVPDNLADYYPKNYYSFHSIQPPINPSLYQRVRKYLLGKIIDRRSTRRGWLGRLLEKRYGHDFIPYWLLKEGLGILHDARILDVGSGSGETLIQLENAGFRNLLGVDLFIPSDIAYPNGVKILKASLDSLDGVFDFIMLHHSFEHMNQPLRVLRKLNSLLAPERFVLLRIPICAYAWEHYRTNWAQIDAPRHLFLHSSESIALLASQAGFKVSEIIYDSGEFQFWASEQYAKDIPLMAENSYGVNPAGSIFSKAEIESYKAKAELLNQEGRGDQACVYLQKIG